MIVATAPSKGVRSRKRKREVEELNSPSADALSEKNLRETAPMVLARWKTTAYKGSSERMDKRGKWMLAKNGSRARETSGQRSS